MNDTCKPDLDWPRLRKAGKAAGCVWPQALVGPSHFGELQGREINEE